MKKDKVKLVINKKEKYICVVFESGNSYYEKYTCLERELLIMIETFVNDCNRVIDGIYIETSVSGEDRRPSRYLD